MHRVSQLSTRTFLQTFSEQFAVAEAVYLVALQKGVDERRLTRAVEQLIERHDALRTVFSRNTHQGEENSAEFSASLIESRVALQSGVVRVHGATSDADALFRCRGAHRIEWPESVEGQILWRIYLVWDSENELRWFSIACSHAIIDGASFAVAFADLLDFYHDRPLDRPIFKNTYSLFESLRRYAMSSSFPNIDTLKATVLGSTAPFSLPIRTVAAPQRDFDNVAKIGVSIEGLTVPFGPWYVKCFTEALANLNGRPSGFINCATHARNIPKHILPHLDPYDVAHIEDLKNNIGFFAFGFMQQVDARWSLDQFKQKLKEGVESAYDQTLASSFRGAPFRPNGPFVSFNMVPKQDSIDIAPFRKAGIAWEDAHRYSGGRELRLWLKIFVVHAQQILIHFDRRV